MFRTLDVTPVGDTTRVATARRCWVKRDPNNERGRIAIRYRGYPTPSQELLIRRIGGCCRVVKNLAKEQRDLAYRITGTSPGYTAQAKDLKDLRDDPEVAPWLAEAPSQILQQAIKDTDTAYKNFFSNKSRYPTWTTKTTGVRFRDPQNVQIRRISRRFGEVKIQGVGYSARLGCTGPCRAVASPPRPWLSNLTGRSSYLWSVSATSASPL